MTIEEFESVIQLGDNCKVIEKGLNRHGDQQICLNAVYLGSDQQYLKFKRGHLKFQIPLSVIVEVYVTQYFASGTKRVLFKEI